MSNQLNVCSECNGDLDECSCNDNTSVVNNGTGRSSGDITNITSAMMESNAYPETVEEVLDDEIKYRRGVIPALKGWKSLKLWGSKTNQMRLDGLIVLAEQLASLYDIAVPTVVVDGIDLDAIIRDTKMNPSDSSSYSPGSHTITMRGNLSIITFLHEFGHALGKNEKKTCRWSINLFKKVFPKQYNKLDHKQHTLVRQRPNEDAISNILNG